MEDKFILGGKEFKSRFILGSGKYNLNLIKAAVEQEGQRSSPLHYDVQIHRKVRIFWTIFRKELPCFRILPVQEMPKRLSASQDLAGQWAVVIL